LKQINGYTKNHNCQQITSGLAKWRLSPPTVRGSQSHHAGRVCETPLRQAAGSLAVMLANIQPNKKTMKKSILISILTAVYFCTFAQIQPIKPVVDERVELMSTVFRLAGAKEYVINDFPLYTQAVDSFFAPMKEHKIISFAQSLRQKYGVSYDAVMKYAINLEIQNGTISFIDNVASDIIEQRWTKKNAQEFLELLNDFYTKSNFQTFFDSQKKLYAIAEQNFQSVLDEVDFDWFEKFFGVKAEDNYRIILGLLNNGSYGPNLAYKDGKRDVFSIIGTWETDSNGNPIYSPEILSTIIHEFCHSYCNSLIDKHYAEMQKKAKEFFNLQKFKMQAMAYGTPKIMLYEILVRACVLKYFESQGYDENIIMRQIRREKSSNGFMWIDELFLALTKYENNRDKYSSLEEFMPEIVKLQNSLKPKKILREQRKSERSDTKIEVIGIENGSKNVDPNINKIIVRFDTPMTINVNGMGFGKKGGFEKYGFKIVKAYWNEETKNEWILEIELEPNKEYSVSFPRTFFRTESGSHPKKTYYLDFKTGN
jgi:hypothetical protein